MYRLDSSRIDLAREFRANPFGEHSPDLQYLLNRMRDPGQDPFHVLIVERPGEKWRLATLVKGARCAPEPTEVVFTTLEEAEWYVFRLRWEKMTGHGLPIEWAR
jgi:N,N-dimethylformamidase